MSWGQNKRIKTFLDILETKDNVKWNGSATQFVDFLHKAIPYLPYEIQEPMDRFYLKGQGRTRNQVTGLHDKEDALFYQRVKSGRAAISFFVKLVHGDPETAMELIGEN